MKPYYEQDGITIYHGDYREALPELAYDAVITDQPYGTGWVRGGGAVGKFTAKHERPDWDVFSLEWIAQVRCAFWAAFCPPSQASAMRRHATACVRWTKTNPRPKGPDHDLIFLWPIFLPDGIEWVGYNGDTAHHPCQKPEPLMIWLLSFLNPKSTVLDPFMGSGTTIMAAKRLGRKAIGIEIEERYCEVAAERLRQGVLTDLFA